MFKVTYYMSKNLRLGPGLTRSCKPQVAVDTKLYLRPKLCTEPLERNINKP